MLVRVLGIGLLVIIAVPLVIAFPPLALLGVGGWFLVATGRRGSSAKGRRRSGVRPRARQRTRRKSSRSLSPWLGRVATWLIVGVVALALGTALAREAPVALGALIVCGIGILIWRRGRSGGRRAATGRARNQASSHLLSGNSVGSGTEFEWHVVDLLKSLNYRRVRHVGGPGDRGIDIIAEDNRGRTLLVQCKRYAAGKKVGSVDIQKLMGAVVHEGADGGIFVTTASYTPAAIALAQTGRVQIALFDGRDVARFSPGWR